jgi:TolA-binding protein
MSNDQPLQPHHGEIPHHDAPAPTPTEAFLEKNFRKIVLLVVIAVAAVAVIGMVRYKSHQTGLAAAELVSSAKTVEDCDLVVQKYPGSVAAGNAMLVKADLLWKANKKDSAIGVLKDFTKSFPKHPFFLSALMGLASKLESAGDKGEAKAIYERMSSEFGKSEFAPLAQIRLGDMLWADGKDEEAKKLFEGLPSKYPGELSVNMSQNRLDLIAAGLPTKEVDGPPQPKKEDKPGDSTGASAPIQITPGGVTPIKLEAGLGPTGTISPTATATPQGTAVTTPAIKIEPTPAPANPPASGPPSVKMIEPAPAPASPDKPATPPSIKLGPPVQQPVAPTTPPAPPAPSTGEAKK